jgi:hypothetical protein
VAALAVVSELALVRIGMAREAILRETEERLGEIFVLDQPAVFAGHVFRGVALSARDTDVFAFEGVAGQLVVELLLRWLPVNERKIKPVVFEMAVHAICATGIFHAEPRVISAICSEMLRNLFVTIETLERWCAGAELVAARALPGAC